MKYKLLLQLLCLLVSVVRSNAGDFGYFPYDRVQETVGAHSFTIEIQNEQEGSRVKKIAYSIDGKDPMVVGRGLIRDVGSVGLHAILEAKKDDPRSCILHFEVFDSEESEKPRVDGTHVAYYFGGGSYAKREIYRLEFEDIDTVRGGDLDEGGDSRDYWVRTTRLAGSDEDTIENVVENPLLSQRRLTCSKIRIGASSAGITVEAEVDGNGGLGSLIVKKKKGRVRTAVPRSLLAGIEQIDLQTLSLRGYYSAPPRGTEPSIPDLQVEVLLGSKIMMKENRGDPKPAEFTARSFVRFGELSGALVRWRFLPVSKENVWRCYLKKVDGTEALEEEFSALDRYP